ncbi:hypothetical protein KTR66_14680 [Roseococcus sp. SDR]|uniref:hypothetical protein n=1 Tax=Roseococcus sp. SDR TaxID=2835532 RepID=UPI001BD090C6|nr:hypothetical protein [Roseococcus sp. SDR]MBS7791246.1 hypothetical protein [Roseococcus sp. SDR]MBV1846560.1 hypothetical protein [Roseococcus sp. SDR]
MPLFALLAILLLSGLGGCAPHEAYPPGVVRGHGAPPIISWYGFQPRREVANHPGN